VAPIVEGHGEVQAVRTLLQRIGLELFGGTHIEVLQPIRQPRSKLLRRDVSTGKTRPHRDEMLRAVGLASSKLAGRKLQDSVGLVLFLLDAEADCPKELSPALVETIGIDATGVNYAVVLANVAYETWFAASATSLSKYLSLKLPDDDILDPETRRISKSWVEDRFRRTKYSETIDQVRLTAAMDLDQCRNRSPSFDKLCRVIAAHVLPEFK